MIVNTTDCKILLTEKIDELILHKFLGFGWWPSECKILIFSKNGSNFVKFIDISKGTSVTNSAEQLIQESWELYLKNRYKKSEITFLESYDYYPEGQVEMILPTWNKDKVTKVEWLPYKMDE